MKIRYYDTKSGRRAFSYVAPRFWNSLPKDIRTITSIDNFKKKLKHILFNEEESIVIVTNRYRV